MPMSVVRLLRTSERRGTKPATIGGLMSDFEFLLSLFGLLLGFTLVEVLGGLVRVTKTFRSPAGKAVTDIKVGWLTPLLALFVILDISSYWVNVWWIRESLPVGFDTVFGGLLIAGSYYFAASLIFPDEVRDWPKLDEWFWSHRRQVLGPLFLVNAVWIATQGALLVDAEGLLFWGIMQILYFGLVGTAFLVRKPALVAGALGILIALYLFFGIQEFVLRFG